MRKHPKLAREVLARVASFRNIAEVAANHHERLDGSGYPRGLSAENLNLPSRILAVADVFDALSQDRPYRPAMPLEQVLAILSSDRGEKLCAQSVAALIELVSKGERTPPVTLWLTGSARMAPRSPRPQPPQIRSHERKRRVRGRFDPVKSSARGSECGRRGVGWPKRGA